MPTGRTTTTDDHSHSYEVDVYGNGNTSEDNGHRHSIAGAVVQRADGHTHELLNMAPI